MQTTLIQIMSDAALEYYARFDREIAEIKPALRYDTMAARNEIRRRAAIRSAA